LSPIQSRRNNPFQPALDIELTLEEVINDLV
jgi:hypothetical protein